MAGDQSVYLVELKTTSSSINDKQAKRYRRCCEPGQTFGKVFGKKLLEIMEDQWMWDGKKRSDRKHQKPKRQLPDSYLALPAEQYTKRISELFKVFTQTEKALSHEDCARKTLLSNKWGSTYKYLYVMGQILDYKGKTLWDMPLKVVYITPAGKCPSGFFSVALNEAVSRLKELFPENEYISMLKSIMKDIYGG